MSRSVQMFVAIAVALGVLAAARLQLANSPDDSAERQRQDRDAEPATPHQISDLDAAKAKPLPENLRWLLEQRDADITRARLKLAGAAFELANAELHEQEATQLYRQLEEAWWGVHRTRVPAANGNDVPSPPQRPEAYVMANAIRDAARRFEAALSDYFLRRQIVIDTYDLKLLGLSGDEAKLFEATALPTTDKDPLIAHACQRLKVLRGKEFPNPFSLVEASQDHGWKAPIRWLPPGVIHDDHFE